MIKAQGTSGRTLEIGPERKVLSNKALLTLPARRSKGHPVCIHQVNLIGPSLIRNPLQQPRVALNLTGLSKSPLYNSIMILTSQQ